MPIEPGQTTRLLRIPERPQKAKGRVDCIMLPEVVGSAEAQTTIREIARKHVKEKVGTHRCRLHGRRGAPGDGGDQQRHSGELGCSEEKAAEKQPNAKAAKAKAARARAARARPRT